MCITNVIFIINVVRRTENNLTTINGYFDNYVINRTDSKLFEQNNALSTT